MNVLSSKCWRTVASMAIATIEFGLAKACANQTVRAALFQARVGTSFGYQSVREDDFLCGKQSIYE